MPKTANHNYQSHLYSWDLYLDSQINGSGLVLVFEAPATRLRLTFKYMIIFISTPYKPIINPQEHWTNLHKGGERIRLSLQLANQKFFKLI